MLSSEFCGTIFSVCFARSRYYPQRVTRASGATGIIPYSQYWYHNHEEDHDNFAGADHLDLDFMYVPP